MRLYKTGAIKMPPGFLGGILYQLSDRAGIRWSQLRCGQTLVTPVFHRHFIDDHEGHLRWLAEDALERFGDFGDDLGFLLRRIAFFGDANVDVRHVGDYQRPAVPPPSTGRTTPLMKEACAR